MGAPSSTAATTSKHVFPCPAQSTGTLKAMPRPFNLSVRGACTSADIVIDAPAGLQTFVRLSPPLQASSASYVHLTKARCVVELDTLGVGSALLLVLQRSPGALPANPVVQATKAKRCQSMHGRDR
ncbi:hypothetical protein V8C42DRAFT_312535 [Trichoderma barbatum]